MSKTHVGPILRATGGRTDNTNLDVAEGSYVVPADVVSGLPGAEGNSAAGHHILDKMFKVPHGEKKSAHRLHGKKPVKIVAAGGEHVLSPEQVAMAGDGDIDEGHRALDAFVKKVRNQNISTLSRLPGPVKD